MEEGKLYHLYNRGHNKDLIFFEGANYTFFLDRLQLYLKDYIDVHAYCLMPNHFHFCIKIAKVKNDNRKLDQAIKNFFISYSKSINKRYNRVGSLFQGSFKCKEITSDSYYSRILTYIHQNPVAGGLCDHLEEYPYSSYKIILSDNPTFIKRTEVLAWFGGSHAYIESHKLISEVPYLSSF